jgi:Transposase zinc-binding domain
MVHSHAAFAPLPAGYVPRAGESSVLHLAVRENMETVLADAREQNAHGFGLPRFIEDELRAFLRCGVLAHGFARVRCTGCGHGMPLAFSCKRRAVCPSCTGRRAADTPRATAGRVDNPPRIEKLEALFFDEENDDGTFSIRWM